MTNKLPKLLALATFSVALFTILNTSSASAANITVNSTADTAVQDDGDCTLREAINNVNSGSDTTDGGAGGDCVAGDGSNDTITLPGGTITLGSNLPQIGSKSVAINGQGIGQTILDGAGQWFLIRANGSASNNLAIRGLTTERFAPPAISADDMNLAIEQVEVDGNGVAGGGFIGGIAISSSTQEVSLSIEDTYIHDFSTSSDQVGAIAGIFMTNKSHVNVNLGRVTIARISGLGSPTASAAGVIGLTGLFDGEGTPADYELDFSNLTVSDIQSDVGAYGLAMSGISAGGQAHITGSIVNSTISGIHAGPSALAAGGLAFVVGSFLADDNYIVDIHTNNLLLASEGVNNCDFEVRSADYGGAGPGSITITSDGGNLSDDNSCTSYFTQPTDQNNVAALAASLLPLADNGGYVPTMALKEGSPAIDSGITVSGLTTDARLALRPQGSAYDSGAYESPYTKPAAPVATLVNSGESIVVGLVVSSVVLMALCMTMKRKQLSY